MIQSLKWHHTVSYSLALVLCLASCSKKETPSDQATPPEQETATGRVYVDNDSSAQNQRISVVVGAELPTEPESLLVIDSRTFADWTVATYQNVKLLCPPQHAHVGQLPGMAQSFHAAMVFDCRFFQIDVPGDTIVIIYYTGPGQAKEITGMNYSFAKGDTLHHWPPNRFGAPVMKYLIPKWQNVKPRHAFLRHGLIALLDNSGENYHRRVWLAHQRGELEPLALLAVNHAVDSDRERRESAIAASFVDFVTFTFGIDKLASLYRSEDSFETTVRREFGFGVDSLQARWLAVLDEAMPLLEQTQDKQ